jgi:hypothetical protein
MALLTVDMTLLTVDTDALATDALATDALSVFYL